MLEIAALPVWMYTFKKFLKKMVDFFCQFVIIEFTGVWRSLVARTAGGREVAGSNPVAPIFLCTCPGLFCLRHFPYFMK